MSIKTYISESEKQYKLRIKSIVPLDDDAMDRIERAIVKYQPINISRPKKTILQSNPLDFSNIGGAEVWIVDLTLGLPASPYVMREDIRKALNAPECYIVVRDENEALEIETKRLNAMAEIEAEATKLGLLPASLLSNDTDYVEGTEFEGELFGNEYNKAFLAYVGKVEAERSAEREKKDKAAFNWLNISDRPTPDAVDDPNKFNDSIKDAPRVAPKASGKLPVTLALGNLDTKSTKISRVYRDSKGNKVVLSREIGKV